jgi:putative transposase
MRQFIVDLQADHPAFRPNEIATICDLHFGRRPSPHTVQRVLAEGPPATRTTRRFPPYQEMTDPATARHAIITLHAEGWNAKSIAAYLATSRQTVHTTLRRWIEEGRLGLEDKSPGPKPGFRAVDLKTMTTIQKEQKENPRLGGFRMHAALLRLGIRVSVRTCNRIMAHHRALYHLEAAEREPHVKKPMPFAASRRHQYWTSDVRYLDTPLLGQQAYCVTILDNFSRAIIASIVSPTQDLPAYLKVLRDAIRAFGSPEAIVTDGGAIFKANAAKAVYAALDIKKEQIDKRQAWQSYIESNFGIQKRLCDVKFEQAATWSELWAMHDEWVTEHNWQVHWAHRHREDGRHTPAEVLGFVRALVRTSDDIERAFRYRSGRTVNKFGFVRYQNWHLYAERGLVGRPIVVWLCGSHVLIEHQDEPLSQYTIEFGAGPVHPTRVFEPRFFEHRFPSPQPFLLDLMGVPWCPAYRAERCRRRHRPAIGASLELPFELHTGRTA